MKGGYRVGAGRKKGFAAKSSEEARQLLAERLAKEIGPISDALIAEAKTGNIQAIRELFDRAWGKPLQALEITPFEQERERKLERARLMREYHEYAANQIKLGTTEVVALQ